jgi:hypothetical protein
MQYTGARKKVPAVDDLEKAFDTTMKVFKKKKFSSSKPEPGGISGKMKKDVGVLQNKLQRKNLSLTGFGNSFDLLI